MERQCLARLDFLELRVKATSSERRSYHDARSEALERTHSDRIISLESQINVAQVERRMHDERIEDPRRQCHERVASVTPHLQATHVEQRCHYVSGECRGPRAAKHRAHCFPRVACQFRAGGARGEGRSHTMIRVMRRRLGAARIRHMRVAEARTSVSG